MDVLREDQNVDYIMKRLFVTLIVLVFYTLLFRSFFSIVLIKGESMEPTFHSRDIVLMRHAYTFQEMPKREEIIVFKMDTHLLVKRVIGEPGDHIEMKNGVVKVNGKKINEPYLSNTYTKGNIDTVVPAQHLFVLGDNRRNSLDSRYEEVGFVSKEDWKGSILFQK